MITAADFKDPKHVWRVKGENFTVEVSRHMEVPLESFERSGPYRWCVYAYVYPDHWLFPQFDPESKSIYHGCISDAPLHGGSSYFRRHFDGETVRSIQFGCDYNHSGDAYYTTLENQKDALSVFGDACRLHDWLTTNCLELP